MSVLRTNQVLVNVTDCINEKRGGNSASPVLFLARLHLPLALSRENRCPLSGGVRLREIEK